jgi:outer membrane lipoprotein SlyB
MPALLPVAGAMLALTLAAPLAHAQARVQYGRVTAVTPTTINNSSSQNVGAILGGGIGLVTGSGQSGSNRALRGLGGAAAGRAVGNLASRSQAFEYTVLIGGTNTVRVVSDQAGKRVGDCVSIEQGQFANIRLVPDSRCTPPPARPAAPTLAPVPAAADPVDVQAANACEQAKQQVLAADTDDDFALAERRMRLLCGG